LGELAVDSAERSVRLGPTVQPEEAEAAARQSDLLEAHQAQSGTTSADRAELEFSQPLLQQELLAHREALEEVVAQQSLLQHQITLTAVLEEPDWPEVEVVERTTRRPRTPAPPMAAPEELVLDSLADLLLHLQALRASKAHRDLAVQELPLPAQTELQAQAQEHVPEEPEDPEAEAEAEPRGSQARAALVELERSFCTGRSKSLCTVTF
jgi:hypothetical protein